MPASIAKREGESEVERHGHEVEVGDLLEPSGSLHNYQLVAAPIRCHHTDFVRANLAIQCSWPCHIYLFREHCTKIIMMMTMMNTKSKAITWVVYLTEVNRTFMLKRKHH